MLEVTDHEEWRDVPGFEGHYEVSNYGNVASVSRRIPCHCPNCGEPTHTILRRGKLLLSREDSSGTHNVRIAIPGKERKYKDTSVARLVLLAFAGPPKKKQYAFHLDGDKTNNHVSNLRWMTPMEYSGWRQHRITKGK